MAEEEKKTDKEKKVSKPQKDAQEETFERYAGELKAKAQDGVMVYSYDEGKTWHTIRGLRRKIVSHDQIHAANTRYMQARKRDR